MQERDRSKRYASPPKLKRLRSSNPDDPKIRMGIERAPKGAGAPGGDPLGKAEQHRRRGAPAP